MIFDFVSFYCVVMKPKCKAEPRPTELKRPAPEAPLPPSWVMKLLYHRMLIDKMMQLYAADDWRASWKGHRNSPLKRSCRGTVEQPMDFERCGEWCGFGTYRKHWRIWHIGLYYGVLLNCLKFASPSPTCLCFFLLLYVSWSRILVWLFQGN